MSNLNYWERRQVEDMYQYMERAEIAADEIAKIYRKSSGYLSAMADDIFEKFRSRYNLTEDEARQLISQMKDKTSLDELLQRLKSGDKSESKRELMKLLEAPAYQARLERLRQIQNQLDMVMKTVYQQEKTFSTSFYMDLANEAYYRNIYNVQQRADAAFSFAHVSAKVIDRVIGSRWSGANYSERIWKNTRGLADTLKEELLVNFITGRTNREAAEIISNKFAQGASNARRLVRTESNFIATEMNFEAYESCGIEKYQYLATLDLRTSETCRELDGRLFLAKDRVVGKNCPPMHPWCRSTTVSVVDESLLANMQRSAIDPATGKRIKVPRTMNYQQWYEKYVKGKPEAESAEKKIKNRSADRKQYDRYKKFLGKDAPKSLDEFQEIKYNKDDDWQQITTRYKDTKLKDKLKSDKTVKTIKAGQQGKHLIGHNNYTAGRSYLTVSMEEAQNLVNRYAGSGRIIRSSRTGEWQNKEKIVVDHNIGQYINKFDGTSEETNAFMIVYANDGTHIIPARRE